MSGDADDLELIPRSVRDKLDRVGVKLHLREWALLTMAERARLRDLPCEAADDVERYRRDLVDLVRRRCGKEPERLRDG
jgi:hypothetical protein